MTSLIKRSALHMSLTVSLGGVVTQFQGLPERLREQLRDLLAPFESGDVDTAMKVSVTRQNVPPLWIVQQDGPTRQGFRSEMDLVCYLEWLAMSYATRATKQYVMLHGGAVTKGLTTVLLAGDSGAGKTTITTGLIQRGWSPLTDDTALISPRSLAITPFPRCFHADEFTISTIEDPALFKEVGSLKGYLRPLRWADAPARADCVVRLARNLGASTSIQPISQAEGAGVILQSAIGASFPRRAVARVAVGIAAGASCWQVNNGPLDDTLDAIERLAAGSNGAWDPHTERSVGDVYRVSDSREARRD
jgi:hypothetical protein